MYCLGSNNFDFTPVSYNASCSLSGLFSESGDKRIYYVKSVHQALRRLMGTCMKLSIGKPLKSAFLPQIAIHIHIGTSYIRTLYSTRMNE